MLQKNKWPAIERKKKQSRSFSLKRSQVAPPGGNQEIKKPVTTGYFYKLS